MMKLISEAWDGNIEIITEAADANGKKAMYITGPFAQANIVNRNRRQYSREGMEQAVNRYMKECVEKRTALGELNHPNRMTIDPERASHLITEMYWDGDNVMGKAKVLSRGMGAVVRGLIEDGVSIGVSTRGAGTVSMNEGISHVGKDFHLAAVDVVTDPSGPSCFVNGLMEGVEWICESGVWHARDIEEGQAIIKAVPKARIHEATLSVFTKFCGRLQHTK